VPRTARLASLVAIVLSPLASLADTPQADQSAAPPAAPAAPAKPPPWYTTITLNGLVDGYYQLRLDAAQNAPIVGRSFDGTAGFDLGYAKLSLAMAPAPAGFRIDIGFGQTADALDAAAAFSQHSSGFTVGHYVQQAYGAMKFGIVELDLGRFSTSAGAEVIEAKDNWLYSRSLVFTLEPLTHTGLRVTVPVNDALSVILGANNGWDAVSTTFAGKTGQISLAYSGPNSTTLAANAYIGENPTLWSGAQNTTAQVRTFLDFVAGTSVGPLGLLANFDYATENGNPWFGGSLEARYSFTGDVARITVRGEYVKDSNGARYGTLTDTEVYEGTVGLSYPVGANSELRLEGRYDHSSVNIFSNGTPTDGQLTGTLAALAWF